jgi:hypothetical protein
MDEDFYQQLCSERRTPIKRATARRISLGADPRRAKRGAGHHALRRCRRDPPGLAHLDRISGTSSPRNWQKPVEKGQLDLEDLAPEAKPLASEPTTESRRNRPAPKPKFDSAKGSPDGHARANRCLAVRTGAAGECADGALVRQADGFGLRRRQTRRIRNGSSADLQALAADQRIEAALGQTRRRALRIGF